MLKPTTEILTMVRFGLVGLVNTGLSVGLMFIMHWMGLPYQVYTTIAYIAGIICSFSLNRWFTFGGDGKDRKTIRFFRFAISNLSLLGLVQVFQFGFIEKLHGNQSLGIALGMVLYTGLGYIVNRIWVFAPTTPIPEKTPPLHED